MRIAVWIVAALAALSFANTMRPATAQESVRRALIVCGLPGDEEHRATFASIVESLTQSLTLKHAFAKENVEVLFAGGNAACAAATRDAARADLEAAAAKLIAETTPEDVVWAIFIGHAHYDRRHALYSLPGLDVHEADVGEMFAGLKAKEQVFFVTIPASGYFLKTLSAPSRVVISATAADLEINETIFPEFLAKRLSEPVADIDGDDKATLVDLYVAIARDVAQVYVDKKLLATEHAQLDDNGDGQGAELQIDFLTEAQGGRPAGADKRMRLINK